MYPHLVGKTAVACECVFRVIERAKLNGQPKAKVLIVAETNNAVDNIARRLVSSFTEDGLFILRLGAPSNVSPDLYELTMEGQLHKKAAFGGQKTHFRYRFEFYTKCSLAINKQIVVNEFVYTIVTSVLLIYLEMQHLDDLFLMRK